MVRTSAAWCPERPGGLLFNHGGSDPEQIASAIRVRRGSAGLTSGVGIRAVRIPPESSAAAIANIHLDLESPRAMKVETVDLSLLLMREDGAWRVNR